GKAGITSDDYVRFLAAPTVKVSSTAGHGVRGKDAVVVTDGTLDISVSADGKKGICSDGPGYFNGGTVVVNVSGSNTGSSSGNGGPGGFGGWGGWGGSSSSSDDSSAAKAIKFDGNLVFAGSDVTAIAKNHEAIESKGTLEIKGGRVYAQSSDDAINAASHLTISGGLVCAYSTGNDGLDANGNMYITGGVVYAVSSGGAEVALDANTEGGYKLFLSGGTVFAIGGLERGAQLTQTCYSASWSKNSWYAMTVGDTTYGFKTPASGGSGLVVSGASTPELLSGVSISGGESIFKGLGVLAPTVSGGTSVNLSSYTNSGGGFGPGGRF
ncbi:MAG: carbohydrate-binding domain-containing protein, partial [Candidatus Faecousia sp.]|nr:carbohydrate-binding domain-containing protein [Candidatus Faecousia sp.]